MKHRIILVLALFSLISSIEANTKYRFRVFFKDKDQTTYSIDEPDKFLSKKAIDRRNRYNIPIDESDLPVSDIYLTHLTEQNMKIISKSKWLNTVVIECSDISKANQLQELSFVDSVKLVWMQELPSLENIFIRNENIEDYDFDLPFFRNQEEEESYYGYAQTQIQMHNTHLLHDVGYKGAGITVAILDAGYSNVDKIDGLKDSNIMGYKDFTTTQEDALFSPQVSDHGTKVFSILAANRPNSMVGVAPEASYWLLRTEDASYEFPIEEDFWAAGVEFADSLGADIISSSLGYSDYDYPTESYTISQLDGKTAFITKSANMAVKKGLLVCNSAGNEGVENWRYIIFPGDAENVITVGSVNKDKVIAITSSRGPTADGRIKPDVVALGEAACIINSQGNVITGNGTSFSTPTVSGLLACLWQAFPDLSNIELIDLLKRHASNYDSPDNTYGSGIPDVYQAYLTQTTHTRYKNASMNKPEIFIDSTGNHLYITELSSKDEAKEHTILINSLHGNILEKKIANKGSNAETIDIQSLQKGLYIVSITNDEYQHTYKLIK